MPTAPQSPCSATGCGILTDSKRCKGHQRRRDIDIDTRRPSSHQRGYDAAWRILRLKALTRDDFTCRHCGWLPESARLAKAYDQPISPEAVLDELRLLQQAGERHLHADHILTIHDSPNLRLNLSNVQTLCSTCHNAKTMLESVRDDR